MPAKLTPEEVAIRSLSKEKEDLQKQVTKLAIDLEQAKAKSKSKVIIPPVIKTKKEDKNAAKKTKRTVVVHKKAQKVEGIQSLLIKTEETIQELTRMLSETTDSKHKGVGGLPKLTTKQRLIQQQLDKAQKRADQLLKLLTAD